VTHKQEDITGVEVLPEEREVQVPQQTAPALEIFTGKMRPHIVWL